MRSPINKKTLKFKKISVNIERLIISLKVNGMSLRSIKEVIIDTVNVKVSIPKIQEIIKISSKKAKILNGIYDSIAFSRIKTIEIDEVYQGREGKFLGCTDKDSMYFLLFKPILSKSTKDITGALLSLRDKLPNLEMIITDMLSSYTKSIPEVFDGVLHQYCLVHLLRKLLNKQSIHNTAAKNLYSKLKKAKEIALNQKKKYQNNLRKVKYYKKKEVFCKNERKICKIKYGLSHHIFHKSAPKEYIGIQNKYSYYNGLLTTYKNARDIAKFYWDEKKKKVSKIQQKYDSKLIERLYIGRQIFRFKKIFSGEKNTMQQNLRIFMRSLAKSSHKFDFKLKKLFKLHNKIFSFLEMENYHPAPFTRYHNNEIECIFGIYRLFLKSLRRIKTSANQRAIFELIRLKHNLTPPRTGFRNDTSPLQRLGIHSRYKCYLDALG